MTRPFFCPDHIMIPALKNLTKTVYCAALYYSGILALLKHKRLRNRVSVLMYHRVLPNSGTGHCYSPPGITVTDLTFAMHLDFLRRHMHVMSAAELQEHLNSGKTLPDYSCLITFDDGWVDNYHHAFPLLKQAGLPALIFLPTDYIGTGRPFWQEHLTRLLHTLYRHPEQAPRALTHFDLAALYSVTDNHARQQIRDYVTSIKSLPYDEIHSIVRQAEEMLQTAGLPPEPSDDGFMDWDQIREMSRSGVSFGSHAISHRVLDRLDENELAHELRESRAILSRQLGTPVTTIAYPNGNHSDSVVDATAAAGYTLGFTTVRGHVSAADAPLRLRRINVHEAATSSPARFFATLLGVI